MDAPFPAVREYTFPDLVIPACVCTQIGFHKRKTGSRVCHTVARSSPRLAFALFLTILLDPAHCAESHDGAGKPGGQYSILFGGDTSYGANYHRQESAHRAENIIDTKGYDYPFERLKPLLSSSDLVIVNLETTLARVAKSPYEGIKEALHRDDSVKAPAALKRQNIQAVSLANNHTFDYGKQGLVETMEALADHGIEFFGAGMGLAAAGRPWNRVIEVGDRSFRLVVIAAYAYRPRYEEDFAFYAKEDHPGVFKLEEETIRSAILEVKKRYPEAFLVIFPHWGWNYQWHNGNQANLAHRMIDAGADLVIGHGAHMLQEIERYHGCWIIYSIGNLMFASISRYQQFNAPPFSIPARLDIDAAGESVTISLRLYPIVSDNQLTAYQPRPVDYGEFNRVFRLLQARSPDRDGFARAMSQGIDETGFFIEFELQDARQ